MYLRKLAVFLVFILVIGAIPFSVYAEVPEGAPSTLEAPKIVKIEVKTNESGLPYFYLETYFPKSILDLSAKETGSVSINYYWKIDNGSWENADSYYFSPDTIPDRETNTANVYYDTFDPVMDSYDGSTDKIEINNHTYAFKAQFYYDYYDQPYKINSSASNVVSIGSGSFYSKATEWAKPELQKAYDLGLIPDILKGADMTKPITREEFCELAVRLYEKVTNTTCTPASPNPFKDTTNQVILKAFKLAITDGTSATTFSPTVLINREQCAAMLFRTIKAIKPDGNYSITGVKDFPDQKYISSWAVQATKYMFKVGIISGDDKGNFMPKATTTAQKAAGYGMATREAAIALTARAFDKVQD